VCVCALPAAVTGTLIRNEKRAASLLVRLRRAEGVERQQIKWFAYAAAVPAIGPILSWVISDAVGVWWLHWEVGFVATTVGLAGLPVVLGIAILRYRLYETDLILNRTLVYGSLTATLVGIYFGGIVVFQRHFVVHTGEQSTLAVVASTLATAALFNPLRRRVQGFVDRRFYRSKYDARETLEALLSLTTPPGCGGMVLVMESKGYECS
jgi:hypothetical protein